MGSQLVECVPNFSEGRDTTTIRKIVSSIEQIDGIRVLHVDAGRDANRTVVTFTGSPAAAEESAFQAIRKAARVIDLRHHNGTHPRMGATDVCPFIPLRDISMGECVELSKRVGQRVGEELQIPVFLYANSARNNRRRNLAEIRRGEYEGMEEKLRDPLWDPDYGPARLHANAGCVAIGARNFLIAYNVNLKTAD
ncbi:MAG TPA: glutamate formimidoyltransferase, partial [bacterium]|nr:glutamate formimidoyltransferase [bacterium]